MAARVLIIEDNQANMDLMVYLLTAYGHQPLSAADGLQGLAMARAEQPHLIICDIHLPRLDGYAVVRALKDDSATRAIPVLAASALPVSDGGAALRAAGFDGHLPKSLEPDTLLPSIDRYLPPALRSGGRPALDDGAAGGMGAATRITPQPARILLLDAAPDDCGLVASILLYYGHAVTVVSNDSQASDCAAQQFDLLLCDLDSSRPANIAFLQQTLPRWPQLPLMLIRSAAEPVDALPAIRKPALLLSHPLEPQQLADALATLLGPPRPAQSDP
jgi:two-component system cell cycle response regulator